MKKNGISIFGSAFKYGQRLNGVDKAPLVLKQLGLIDVIKKQGYDVNYNIYYPRKKDLKIIADDYYTELAKNIYKERKRGNKIINIGGDHSVAIGSINEVLKFDPDTIIIWYDDAHIDK